MQRFLTVCLLIGCIFSKCLCDSFDNTVKTFNDALDQDLSFTEIIEKYGYPVELHEIETEDGYLLDTYRVPYGINSTTKEPNKYPVILNHGLMGSAENFLIGGPRKALPYILADHGYDVWLCNARGTWHSRKHKTLDPDNDPKFWKFTWHEIGYYDLPATIDYILKETHAKTLSYIGHSQGTTVFFVMGSERPEYNKKINIMIGLAPSAFLGHLTEPHFRMMAPMYRYLQQLGESLKMYELIPNRLISNEGLRFMGKNLCGEQATTKELCTNLLLTYGGFTVEQLDPATIPLIASTGPGGCSLYQPLHYAQLVVTGKFIQYDWGPKENLKRYNSLLPSEYRLKNVTCPVSLMWGQADTLVTPEDVAILATKLPNVVDYYKVPYEKWFHVAFIWAKDDVAMLANKLPNVVDYYKVPYEKWSHMEYLFAKDVNKYVNRHVLKLLEKFKQ